MATWTKLRDGAWGIRVEGATAPVRGAPVEVKSKAGEVKSVKVARVVWSGDGIHVCSVEAEARSSSSSRRHRGSGARWRSCGYPGCNPNHCDECDGDGADTFYS